MIKKVIDQNFPYFDAKESSEPKEIDLHAKLPEIEGQNMRVEIITTEKQPQYRNCWFEGGPNTVMNLKQGNNEYLAILNNSNYCYKIILYRVQGDKNTFTCIGHSYKRKLYQLFASP